MLRQQEMMMRKAEPNARRHEGSARAKRSRTFFLALAGAALLSTVGGCGARSGLYESSSAEGRPRIKPLAAIPGSETLADDTTKPTDVVPTPDVIPSASNGERLTFTSVHTGSDFSCGLRASDGRAQCWGNNEHGQSAPPEAVAFDTISLGLQHACGINSRDGNVVCWGKNEHGQADAPRDVQFRAIASGYRHSCGVRELDGEVSCWGANVFGESSPPSGMRLSALTAGYYHTCGLGAGGGTPVCWGDDGWGQQSSPPGVAYKKLLAGFTYTCGIRTADDEAECWGKVPGQFATPLPGVAVADIGLRDLTVCAVRASDRSALCWGDDEFSQTLPPADMKFDSIAVAWEHACGLLIEGGISCWGKQDDGRASAPDGRRLLSTQPGVNLGCALSEDDGQVRCWGAIPSLPRPGASFTHISVAKELGCGLRQSDGGIECWSSATLVPTAPPGPFAAISVGDTAVCATDLESRVQCWDYYSGLAPPALDTALTARHVSVGGRHACAVRESDGHAECWSFLGARDLLTTTDATFDSIDVGDNYACGVRSRDSELECWGSNDYGQAAPPAGIAFANVSAGAHHTCGITLEDSTVACWGDDQFRQASPPARLPFRSLSAGVDSTCGVRADDGTDVCWGRSARNYWR